MPAVWFFIANSLKNNIGIFTIFHRNICIHSTFFHRNICIHSAFFHRNICTIDVTNCILVIFVSVVL